MMPIRQFSSSGPSMSEKEYLELVNIVLDNLTNTIDEVEHSMIEDLNYADGVLTIEMWDERTYVLNKQAPNK